MARGGKRLNAGRRSYSPEFIEWVFLSIRREIDEYTFDAVKRRASNEKGLQGLRRQIGHDSNEEEAKADAELEVAQGWKDGLVGQELHSRLSEELGRSIDGVYVSASGLKLTPSEMNLIYKKVSDAGCDPQASVSWSHISPKIVKRAWLQARRSQRELEAGLKKER